LPFKSDYKPVTHQTPCPVIEIYLPDNSSTSEPDCTFRADAGDGALSKLQGYNFTESVSDLEGNFSFSVKNGEIKGKSIFDLITIRSVVKIYEGTEYYPAFVGIIRFRKINKQMTNSGLKEVITFSGKSVISCISEYQVSLDVRISNVLVASKSLNYELTDKLLKADDIAKYISVTWNYFLEISDRLNENKKSDKGGVGIVTTHIGQIINKYIGETKKPKGEEMPEPLPFVTVTGDTSIKYKLGSTFMNQSNNSVADCWRSVLPKSAYELFAYCDNIIIRGVKNAIKEHR